MKIAFDVSVPKQALFFEPMMARLRAAGCQVVVVTRSSDELNLVRRSRHMRATVLGRYGGPTLLGKLVSFTQRVGLVARYFARQRPDVVVLLGGTESARAAFGLQIPVICFNDLPESTAIAKLTLPLATRVCAPWLIPKSALAQHGVPPTRVFSYRALDPLA
jgi:hypothetical protein